MEKETLTDEEIFEMVTDKIREQNPKFEIVLPFTMNDLDFVKRCLVYVEEESDLFEIIDEAYFDDIRDTQYDLIFDAMKAVFPDGIVSWQTISFELQSELLEDVLFHFCIEPPFDEIFKAIEVEKAKKAELISALRTTERRKNEI